MNGLVLEEEKRSLQDKLKALEVRASQARDVRVKIMEDDIRPVVAKMLWSSIFKREDTPEFVCIHIWVGYIEVFFPKQQRTICVTETTFNADSLYDVHRLPRKLTDQVNRHGCSRTLQEHLNFCELAASIIPYNHLFDKYFASIKKIRHVFEVSDPAIKRSWQCHIVVKIILRGDKIPRFVKGQLKLSL